jgi:hypothetical protein
MARTSSSKAQASNNRAGMHAPMRFREWGQPEGARGRQPPDVGPVAEAGALERCRFRPIRFGHWPVQLTAEGGAPVAVRAARPRVCRGEWAARASTPTAERRARCGRLDTRFCPGFLLLPAQVQRELVCQGNVWLSGGLSLVKIRQRFARGFKHPKLSYLVISPLTANAMMTWSF